MSKRAERRAHIKRLGRKRRKLVKNYEWWAPGWIDERSDNELATRHPYDCGRHCLLCHFDKFMHKKARRQKAKQDTRDYPDEY